MLSWRLPPGQCVSLPLVNSRRASNPDRIVSSLFSRAHTTKREPEFPYRQRVEVSQVGYLLRAKAVESRSGLLMAGLAGEGARKGCFPYKVGVRPDERHLLLLWRGVHDLAHRAV